MKKKLPGHTLVFHWILSDPFGIEHTPIGAELFENTDADFRDEGGQKDHMADGALRGYEREKHTTRRMRYDYHVAEIIIGLVDRLDNDVRIPGCAGLRFSSGQIRGQSHVPALLKLLDEEIPALRALNTAVNQKKQTHHSSIASIRLAKPATKITAGWTGTQ
jgi:hypothetical protein